MKSVFTEFRILAYPVYIGQKQLCKTPKTLRGIELFHLFYSGLLQKALGCYE